MTANSPIDVDTYLSELPHERRERFGEVRGRIHAAVSGLGETISYKMPAVTWHDDVVLFFASWTHHTGLYPIPRFDGPLEEQVSEYRAATDTVRFPHRRPIPDGLIEAITAAIVTLHDRRITKSKSV
jgi:uncharacterized protein YdhG (YjbR/CyaY superfamily)